VQCVARISVTAIADGVGAFGFARPPGLWADSSFVERSRRRRSHKSIASANLTASIGRSHLLHSRRGRRRFVQQCVQRVGTAA